MKLKESKRISLTGFVIGILVLLLVVLMVSIYYIYTLRKKVAELEEEAIKTATTIREINKNTQEENEAPVTEVHSSTNVEENTSKATAMTTDEKFEQYIQNLKAVMKKYNEEKVEGKEYREYQTDGKDANNKNYFITLSGNGTLKLNEKEVETNVIGFNVAYTGNGGYKNLYFIKDDGTVAYASIDEIQYLSNGKVKTTSVKDLKNIISIIGGVSATYGHPGACYAYAIDIEGNMFEIK